MKKVFATILAVIYLVTSTGATINIHYCMGNLYSVDLLSAAKCSKCGMETSENGCCKDEFKVVKVKDSHQLYANDVSLDSPFAIIDNHYSLLTNQGLVSVAKVAANSNSPPGSSGISICIRNCVFRI